MRKSIFTLAVLAAIAAGALGASTTHADAGSRIKGGVVVPSASRI